VAAIGLAIPNITNVYLVKWLRAQPDQPSTIDDLQAMIDAFIEEYNDHRPHAPGPPGHPHHGLHHPPQGHPDHRRPRRRHPRPRPP
jgi:hypothetical protein